MATSRIRPATASRAGIEGAAPHRECDPLAGLLAPTLNSFLLTADFGSFSAAARALGVRQSTVSRQIQDLEDRLGVSIFERHGAGVRPTDAGRELLSRLRQVRGLVRTAVGEARDCGAVRTGRLRLGFVGSFTTSPAREVLGHLRALHPDLRLQLSELGASELIHQVANHELDCAWVPSWRSPDPRLVLEPLWSEALYLARPVEDDRGELATWSDVGGHVLLARPEAEVDLLFQALEAAGVSPPEVQRHDLSRESLVALVAEGEGVAILSESFARLGRPGVRFTRIDEPEAVVSMCALYRRDRDNPALRRFLAISRDWVRRQPEPGGPSDCG